jgi:ureidoglycolate dehydrogenase (NAD+)
MRPEATIRELRSGPSFAVFDAQQALGACSSKLAMERAVELAQPGAAAFALVQNGTHFGAAGHWALLAAEAGCIGFATSNGGGRPVVLAFGSRQPALTNGPIAWAIPAKRHPAIVADLAVGMAAVGKVRVAAAAGQPIPDHWGVDADGHPTNDPTEFAFLNPFAGPKGFGLGIVVETLAGILAGAIPAVCRQPDDPLPVGQVFGAINIEAFRPLDEFLAEVDAAIDRIHTLRPAPGVDRVLVPGEPEWIKRARALEQGIEYPSGLLESVEPTGRRLGVPPAWT